MRRVLLFVFFFLAISNTNAQEKIHTDTLTYKSTINESLTPQISIPSLIESDIKPGIFQLFDKSEFSKPLIPDYNRNLDFKKYVQNSISSYSFNNIGYYFNPFITNGMVFNQSIYRLNDHFAFGGNSFGAQSIFDRPNLNPEIQNMNIRGASMFFQYKVSDKFKIETRVNISNQIPPFTP